MGKNKSAKRSFFTALAIIVIIVALFITGCARAQKSDIIEIKERMFISQIQDIYLNTNDFMGKTIKLEGIFMESFWNESYYYYVIRYVPDPCCGTDSIGFMIKWPDGLREYPENNSWVETTGELKLFEDDFFRNLYIELTSLTVLETRGSEFVSR